MGYKELIKNLRVEGWFQEEKFGRNTLSDELSKAATAIETLLAERDAAEKYIPRICQTCKWWDVDEGCIAPAHMGECLDLRELWQWRGP